MLTHHLHLDRVAQVRLVGAIPKRCIPIRNLRPLRINLATTAELFEHALKHRLDRVEHVLLGDERHLHIQLVKVGRRPIRARIFIPETRRNLEILVEPRHHQQLLELLRGLRQRIELARMQPRRHQKVPRALGGRRRDDRRLILAERLVPHPLADRGHNIRAHRHIALQFLAAQVQIAIAQSRFLRILLIAEHHQRQLIRRPQHFHIADKHLDLAGGDLVVHQALVTCLHGAINPDTPFRTHLFDLGKNRAIGVRQHLCHAEMIPQVDEQQPPVIAHPVHPARQAHIVAHIGFVQIGASMAAIGVHGGSLGVQKLPADTPAHAKEVKQSA